MVMTVMAVRTQPAGEELKGREKALWKIKSFEKRSKHLEEKLTQIVGIDLFSICR